MQARAKRAAVREDVVPMGRQDPAVALAHDAIATMRDLRVSPTPENFRLWYLYHAGTAPALRRELAQHIEQGRPLAESELAAIQARHAGLEEPHAAALGAVARQVAAALEEGLSLIADAEADATRYGETLHSAGRAIHAGGPQLAPVLARLLHDTMELCRRSHAAAERLHARTQEARQLRAALEEARRAAQTDPLTALPNRRAFEETIDALIEAGERVSLALLDVDRFKEINDTHGHSAGDLVLREVAGVLKAGRTAGEWPARIGGDEFAMVLPGSGRAEAEERSEALRRAIAELDFLASGDGPPFTITTSIGVAEHKSGEAAEALISRADQALYAAKRGGRDRVGREGG
jgi:diguanylate cyclase